ncbi:MAG: XRE family transcriptional regulator [Muribaculaceae bacterium]|nr:XRE family transcriptional regulator [Muribaculaceae bacterium]
MQHAESAAHPILIGHLIEAELRRQERTVTWLSRKLNCDRRNIYSIFAREFIDTGLLFKISLALGKDFFAVYSSAIHSELEKAAPHPTGDR